MEVEGCRKSYVCSRNRGNSKRNIARHVEHFKDVWKCSRIVRLECRVRKNVGGVVSRFYSRKARRNWGSMNSAEWHDPGSSDQEECYEQNDSLQIEQGYAPHGC